MEAGEGESGSTLARERMRVRESASASVGGREGGREGEGLRVDTERERALNRV